MKAVKIIVSFILSLALLMLILAFQISLFTKTKILTPEFYISSFEEENFYSYIETSINESFTDLGLYTHLPGSLFTSLVTKDWIKVQVDKEVTSIVNYITNKSETIPEIDSHEQPETFIYNLDKFITDENIKVDESTRKQLDAIGNDISNIITSNVSIIDLKGLLKSQSFQNIRQVLYIIYSNIYFILAGILFVILLLFFINIRDISSSISWTAYSLIAAGFIMLIPSTAGIASNFIDNIAISEGVLKDVIVSLVTDTLWFFAVLGLITSGVGAATIAAQSKYERSRNKKATAR